MLEISPKVLIYAQFACNMQICLKGRNMPKYATNMLGISAGNFMIGADPKFQKPNIKFKKYANMQILALMIIH